MQPFDNLTTSIGRQLSVPCHVGIKMGFVVTTLIFVVIGVIACLCTRICCNRGPSTNLLHLTLVITATVCCWMIARCGGYKDEAFKKVGDCLSCTDESTNSPNFERRRMSFRQRAYLIPGSQHYEKRVLESEE
ncbi:hypothetical protein AgCh_031446 [Apium graveolens]